VLASLGAQNGWVAQKNALVAKNLVPSRLRGVRHFSPGDEVWIPSVREDIFGLVTAVLSTSYATDGQLILLVRYPSDDPEKPTIVEIPVCSEGICHVALAGGRPRG
jgi:hypothetical protein